MKVEEAIKRLDGIDGAVLNFSAKTLSVKSELEEEKLIRLLKATIDKVEDGVTFSRHEHQHEHRHEHSHEHHCDHEHCHEHSHEHHCDHEHCHEHSHEHHCEHEHREEEHIHANRKYTIDGLDCANCAVKVEEAIKRLDGIDGAVLNFSAKTLSVKSELEEEKLIRLLKATIDKVEDGVTLSEQKKEKSNKKKISKDKAILFEITAAAVILAAGLLLRLTDVPEAVTSVLMAISALISGYRILIKGFKAIIRLNLNENVLMSIAVIAAILIGEFFEAAAVTILASIGELFENKAVNTSRTGIERLSQIRPDTAHIIESGGVYTVDAEEVEKGTEILINPYERIPLDGVIYEGSSIIDTSALTGESIPRNASIGDSVMSGMMNLDGVIKIRTTETCEDSAAARILRMVEESAAQKGKAENFITRFAKVYTPIILACAILISLVPPLILGFESFYDWLNRALVFLVASCPCALVISVPLGFYSGIGACSRAGVLIKGGKYIEALSKAENIAFDKTGTLTSGELSVTKIISRNGAGEDEIIRIAAAAEEYSTHPAALAIKRRADGMKLPKLENNRERAGYGVTATLDGKKIECGGKRMFNDNRLSDGAIYLSIDGEIVGEIYVEDTIRSDAEEIVGRLSKLGFKHIAMLTGDSEENAAKIAKECGLSEYKAALLPEDKRNEVERLQNEGRTVFVGDGINDAPVLAKSNCGFAMGLGSEAAIESADAVLVGGTLAQLPAAIELSRKTMKAVYFNIIFALAVKAVILVLAVCGIAPMWLAVLADTGVAVLTVLNSSRILKSKTQ